MKRELLFYKWYYTKLTLINFVPVIEFSKNVQGHFFTRNYCLYWLRYCVQLSLIVTSDFNEERSVAHEKNVERYMQKRGVR